MLQAVANIVRNPSYPGYPNDQQDPVFRLSLAAPLYQPALAQRPTSWLLFLKITGGFYSAQDSTNLMNGPATSPSMSSATSTSTPTTCRVPSASSRAPATAPSSSRPWGENALNSPFLDGGLSGQGFGVLFDPTGRLWIGNFGFQDPPCETLPQKATKNSVSLFTTRRDRDLAAARLHPGQYLVAARNGVDLQGNIWTAIAATTR